MKEFRFKIFLIVAFVGICLYLLYPTYQDYKFNNEISETLTKVRDSIKTSTPTISQLELDNLVEIKENNIIANNQDIKNAREKKIKLGLDLQGGMYLVLEVNTIKLLEKLAKNPEDADLKALFDETLAEATKSDQDVVSILASKVNAAGKRMSLYFGNIRESDDEIIDRLQEQEADAVTRAIEIINNRVNQYGVSEPNIQKQGARRIIVELPGIAKEEEAKRLLQGNALLEFKLLKEPAFAIPIMNSIDDLLAAANKTDSTEQTDSLTADQLTEEEFAQQHPFYSIAMINPQSPYPDAFVKEQDKDKITALLSRADVQSKIPNTVEFLFSAKPEAIQEGVNIFRLYMVNRTPELTGGVIVDATATVDPSTSNPIVTFSMNPDGARDWARITGANVNKRLAVVLDGFVYTAPNINGKIVGGRSQVEGMENLDEAKLIEIVLKAGALPAPLDLIEERTVGPSLGQDSISQGLNSTMIGFLFVAIFMVIYYRISGSIADLALMFTILFIMGILAGFKAALTLPGIAGIILTIGMAVDANVLIYERIREELSTGKTIKASIQSGYQYSYSAIFDSNITTFFTAIILYQFGSGPIQGFALTLMIGIVCSLFSALVVTRLFFDYMASKGMKINIG